MSSRRNVLAGAAAGFVAGCGGGGGQAVAGCSPTLVTTWFGDSVQSGSIALDPTSGQTGHIQVRPGLRAFQNLGGRALVIDRSVPGMLLGSLVVGWASTLDMDPSTVLVLRFGGADALAGVDPGDFESNLRKVVMTALQKGRVVVLSGVVEVARKPEWQPGITDAQFEGIKQRRATLDGVIRGVAASSGSSYVGGVQFSGPEDLADGFHPAQAYSNRWVDALCVPISRGLGLG